MTIWTTSWTPLPLTEQQRTLIGLNAIASVQLITQAHQELLDRF